VIDNFISAHRFLAYLAGASFFALSGYGFARLSPKDPSLAIGSWIMALLWFAFGLATTRALLPVGPILALAVLVGGGIWMAQYYKSHRPG
jgi:hypothetical protein